MKTTPKNHTATILPTALSKGMETLQGMKMKLTLFIVALYGLFGTTSAFGQVTATWTNQLGGLIYTAANWDPNVLPNGNDGSGIQQTAQWDGRTSGNLVISNNSASGLMPNTGFGTIGINFALTGNQLNDVQIISTVPISGQVGFNNVTNNSPHSSLILGDFNTPANLMRLTARPAASIHYWENNSTAPVIINPSVEWQAGGGNAYTMEFLGTGNFIVRSSLRTDNGAGGTSVTVDGPGTVTWTNGTTHTAQDSINLITVNAGKLILQSPGLLPPQGGNSTITLNAPLVFDAAGKADTITRVITDAGTGTLIVSNGTLTLSGQNTYLGNTIVAGGELVAGRSEAEGTYGPFGLGGIITFAGGTLGCSLNNAFDYSSRFDTAAGQAYSFDTAGQSLTLATGLGSSGGTLTKLGAGTLTLSAPASYSGATTVSVGTLVFHDSKTGTGNITEADGATLGLTATGTQVTPNTLALGSSSGCILEFNNVNSTATAPLAATTLTSAGTVTINIKNSTFNTIGLSYPLLTWTSGSAPAVSLGSLSGAAGNLSTNGNSIVLNITATPYIWTGGSSGNWDTTATGNWVQSAVPKTYVDGVLALLDDSATGTTTVTVNSPVLPQSVTVNNSLLPYSIASSGANNISGTAGLTKNGTNTLTVSGGANTYTGVTTVGGGTLSVASLANSGSPSDIGGASSAASSLVLNGGTLQYTGTGVGIDHLFTIGTSGATIEDAGSGALAFTNTGTIGLAGAGPRGLTLLGSDLDNNLLAGALTDDPGGPTSLTKDGTGLWIITGANTHSGVTTINNGILQVGTDSTNATLGTGTVVDDGVIDFHRAGTLTVSGGISGTGSVTNNGVGTVILAGNNTYSGGTVNNAGTLQIGNGGSTGTLNINSGVQNYSTLVFNSSGGFTLNGVISGTGNLVKRGSGLLKLLGNNTFTGGTTIDAGGVLQICSGNQGSFVGMFITNNGSLIFVRQDNAIFTNSSYISGTGSVTKEGNNDNIGDITITGTNSYTGGTFIKAGNIILGDGFTHGAGTIVGNVTFANSGVTDVSRGLFFNYPDDVTFGGNILDGITGTVLGNRGNVVQNGAGILTLTGNSTYRGGTTINTGALQVGNGGASGTLGTGGVNNSTILAFNRSDNAGSFSNVISGAGAVENHGSGAVTLTGNNTYTGNTVVTNGGLYINNTNVSAATLVQVVGKLGGTGTLAGPVSVDPGCALAPGAFNSIGTLTINSDLALNGNVYIDLNKSLAQSNDLVVVSGQLINGGTGSIIVTNRGTSLTVGDKFTLFSQPLQNGAAMSVVSPSGTATWVNNLATDGSISVASVTVIPQPTLATPSKIVAGGTNYLQFTFPAGYKLQSQSVSLSVGIGNNWTDVANGATSPVNVPLIRTNGVSFLQSGAVFYRLATP